VGQVHGLDIAPSRKGGDSSLVFDFCIRWQSPGSRPGL
jgi:hypothetical protein